MEQMQWIAEGSAEFSKASDDGGTERKVGAGLMAGGGMGVTLGTVASGVPGFKAKPGDSALRRAPGGIFGGRHASHTDVTGKYEGKAGGGAETLTGRVRAARNAGKVRAEKDVLRELAAGHRAGRIGQAGGAVMLGGGYAAKKIGDRKRAAQQGPLAKSSDMARRREERGSLAPSAMIGGGATTAAATYGVSRGLGSRAKQWEDRAAHHAGLAEQQMPGSTGPKMDERQLRKRIRRKGGSLNYEKLDQASRHAGEASQSKYLAGAYRAHAKAFKGVGHAAAATALAGAGIEAKRALGRRRAQQGPVDKRDGDRSGAYMGAGGTGLAIGTLASGVPGYKVPDASERAADGALKQVSFARKMPGGIFGTRKSGHETAKRQFVEGDEWHRGRTTRRNEYLRGRNRGKIGPEVDVLRELKIGNRAGRALQAVGATSLAYGAAKAHKASKQSSGEVVKRDDGTRRGDAAIGAGLTAGAAGYGIGAALGNRSNYWGRRADSALAESNRIVPGAAPKGADGKRRPWDLSDRGTGSMSQMNRRQLKRVGELHGDAAQSRYFGNAYRANAKAFKKVGLAGLAVAGAGAVDNKLKGRGDGGGGVR